MDIPQPITYKVPSFLRGIILFALSITAFLAPLLHLPVTSDPLFAKQIFVTMGVIIALLAWLTRALLTKEFSYKYGIVNLAGLVCLLTVLVVSFFSTHVRASFFGIDGAGDRFFSLLTFFVFTFLVAAEFTRKEALWGAILLMISGSILGATTLLRLFIFEKLPAFLQTNPVGTLNASVTVSFLFFLLALAFILLPAPENRLRRLTVFIAWVTCILSSAVIFLVNFHNGWLALAALSVLIIAFISSRRPKRNENTEEGHRFTTPAYLVFLAILGFSIFFAVSNFNPSTLLPSLRTEVEVAPSFQTTLAIGLQTLEKSPLLGSGPGTFSYDYARYRPPAINQTIFWNTKFFNGFSFLTTLLATSGVLGILAFLVLIGTVLYTLWRIPSRENAVGPLELGFGSIVLLGIILWFIYAASFTLQTILFFSFGVFFALLPPSSEGKKRFWQKIGRRTVSIEHPAVTFASSLFVLSIVIFTLLGAFNFAQRYAAEVYAAEAIHEFTKNGNSDTALVRYDSALALNSNEDGYFVNQSQLYIIRAQQALTRVSAGDTSAQGDFQTNLNAAITAAQRATALNPEESLNWLNLGAVYEAALPFVDGTAQFAVAAYGEATKHDPVNPSGFTLLGRTHLEYIDLLDFRIQQGALLKNEADMAKRAALAEAKNALKKAIELKSDYATAQFLLAQAYTREGNIDEAIRNGSYAALAAPQDTGVAFYLGFLFYQKNRMDDAETQFLRAIELNPSYSNARYFLGLIYDTRNKKAEALAEFEKISELNPGNTEVERIIKNLQAGKPALSAIKPLPEKRIEPPIQDFVK